MCNTDIDRLDPALIRPGRVDVIHHIGHATASQCHRMFLKFFPDRPELAQSFVAAAGHTELSMALLQSYFMLYRHSAEEACQSAAELCAGVDAARTGSVPVQQSMAEMAVRESQQQHEQHSTPHGAPHGAGAAAAASEGRSYPRPDPSGIPLTPPPRES